MAEVELYGPIKRFLEAQGYTVKGEIGPCDIVGNGHRKKGGAALDLFARIFERFGVQFDARLRNDEHDEPAGTTAFRGNGDGGNLVHAGKPGNGPLQLGRRNLDPAEVHGVVGAPLGFEVSAG